MNTAITRLAAVSIAVAAVFAATAGASAASAAPPSEREPHVDMGARIATLWSILKASGRESS